MASPTIPIFSVPEVAKRRRRVILHTVDINKQSYPDNPEGIRPIEIAHTSIADLISTHGLVYFAVTLDAAAYYNQFALDEPSRNFYTFEFKERQFRLATIPTGQRHCVAMAETINRAKSRGLQTPVGTDTYIDNFIFFDTNPKVLSTFTSIFMEVCRNVNVTLNEEVAPTPQQTFEFRGIEFGLNKQHNRTFRTTEKTREKLRSARQVLQDPQATMRQTLGLFGLCIYTSFVVNWETHSYYHIFKYIRRRGTEQLEAPADIWESIKPLWDSWIQSLLSAKRNAPHYDGRAPIFHVFSDASLSGFGHVIFQDGQCVDSGGGVWDEHERKHHINILEAMALRRAVLRTPPGAHCHCIVDNTSLMYALQKGRSRNYLANQIVGSISDSRTILSTSYIASADNPADPW
eukprot:CAMPEP_0176405114 /NCGR_PEP_ID=MMETSP0127-20121128/166_1 /TAXON_ID=938130 /ORGANISM="Platyophrya macrostoma, Strain WH" /LENGTH=403 /DNA_ID=CAMNT_0017784153 /DNA_START=321 /DNA_END=1529 /DNA_ORIENTATION=+